MEIKLEKHEVTVILRGLAKLPYEESAALIRKIVEQTSTNQNETT